MERFFTDAVPGQEEASLLHVPKGEGEHTPQTIQASCPFFFVKMKDDLGIGPGLEAVPLPFQFSPKLHKVVNLSVKNQPDSLVLISHGLGARRRQVDNAQPLMA